VITVYAANQFLISNYIQMIPLNFYLLYPLVFDPETAADVDKRCLFGLNTDNPILFGYFIVYTAQRQYHFGDKPTVALLKLF